MFGGNPKSYQAQFIGPFVSATEDTVTMRNAEMNDALVAVPTLHVTKLEISDGKSSNGLTGACIGLAIGAVLGLAVALSGESTEMDSAATYGLVAGVGGALGAGIGALIGDASSQERWRELSLAELRSPPKP